MAAAAAETDEGVAARRLLADTVVIDALGGNIVSPEPPAREGKDFITRVLETGINTMSVTTAAHADGFDAMTRAMFNYFCLFDHQPDRVMQIRTVADIHEARRSGRLGVMFCTQTGGHVGDKPWRWTIAAQLGLRIASIAYNERNALGGGCLEPNDPGLSAFGRQAVQEMNRLGILVDISHTGWRTSADAVAYSAQPVVATHSNAHALTPSPRNLPDSLAKAVADTGGVVGCSPFSAMTWREHGVRPSVPDFIAHLEHMIDLVGIDHVGIGSDIYESYTKVSWESTTKRMYPTEWFWETRYSDGFDRVEGWTNVVAALLARGYEESSIRKILGQNWLRVFDRVWPDAAGQVELGTAGWSARPGGILGGNAGE